MPDEQGQAEQFDASALRRPDPALLRYYLIASAFTLIAFPFVFTPLWIKYATLRYRFDEEGVSMAWGALFRKEVLLTYRRIQDIHVKRNLLHRWLGLAEVAIQTASGAGGAEMTIVGVTQPERLRDFLYSRMRGARGEEDEPTPGERAEESPADEALALLKEIRDELRAQRAAGGSVS